MKLKFVVFILALLGALYLVTRIQAPSPLKLEVVSDQRGVIASNQTANENNLSEKAQKQTKTTIDFEQEFQVISESTEATPQNFFALFELTEAGGSKRKALINLAGRLQDSTIAKQLLQLPLNAEDHALLIESLAYHHDQSVRDLAFEQLNETLQQGDIHQVMGHIAVLQHYPNQKLDWMTGLCRFTGNNFQFEVLKRTLLKNKIFKNSQTSPLTLCQKGA